MYDDKFDTIDRTKVSTLMVHWHPVPVANILTSYLQLVYLQ